MLNCYKHTNWTGGNWVNYSWIRDWSQNADTAQHSLKVWFCLFYEPPFLEWATAVITRKLLIFSPLHECPPDHHNLPIVQWFCLFNEPPFLEWATAVITRAWWSLLTCDYRVLVLSEKAHCAACGPGYLEHFDKRLNIDDWASRYKNPLVFPIGVSGPAWVDILSIDDLKHYFTILRM